MRRIILILSAIACLTIPCFSVYANPMLTCDCSNASDGITAAQVQFDSGSWITATLASSCGSGTDKVTCTGGAVTICHDLASLSTGNHTVKGKWSNSQGRVSADSAPLSFTILGTPAGPQNQRLVTQ
jgi:hypothetical protein